MKRDSVKAKKHLGQHFLKDMSVAERIADTLQFKGYTDVLEIGPGTGNLTQFLLKKPNIHLKVAEIDRESVAYLKEFYPTLAPNIIEGDFLKKDLSEDFPDQFALTGNYPYNISSQILFRALEYKDKIPEITGMFQKEVAERVASGPGSKIYGVISVLLQAFYDAEYLFTVDEHVFNPPPKVKSGVIRLTRKENQDLGCEYKKFRQVVKAGFGQRRKTLRNGLKPFLPKDKEPHPYLSQRAEQLSVDQFVELTNWIFSS